MGAYYSDDCRSSCDNLDGRRPCPNTGFHYCYRESDKFLIRKQLASYRRVPLPEDRDEKGNAIAAFVLIIPLVLLVLFSLVSLIYALYIRAALEDAAFEGAKAGSLSGGDSALAESHTRDVLDIMFNEEYCVNPDITSRLLPDRSIEVSIHCPVYDSLWFGSSLPEMTVSTYAHIE